MSETDNRQTLEDLIRPRYQHLCADFGKENVDIAIRNLQNEKITCVSDDEDS